MSAAQALGPRTLALVTGAGSGIGRSIALALAEKGCRVVLAGRRLERVAEVARQIGATAVPVVLDVADRCSVQTLFERLPADWHAVDVLVNNAGHDVGGRRRFDEGSVEEWCRIIETNVIGLVQVTRLLVDGMLTRRRGHIVNIGSTAGLQPYATGALYASSKHAVHGFSESLRLDYAGTGVRVSEILPGMVRFSSRPSSTVNIAWWLTVRVLTSRRSKAANSSARVFGGVVGCGFDGSLIGA